MSTKILELNFTPDQLPSTLEIVETSKDRFVLTGESLASLTGSQLEWLEGTVSIDGADQQKLLDFRTDLIKPIYADLLSIKLSQLNSMGDTNTVYSQINPGDDSIFDNEMPDVMNHFNQQIDSALEKKTGSAKLISNFSRITIILATKDSVDLQDKDADMILEAKVAGDNFKSKFGFCCNKIFQRKTRETKQKRIRKKILTMCS